MQNHQSFNVLIVHNKYQYKGGEDTVVETESKLLQQHGHNVFFYIRQNCDIFKMSIFSKLLLPVQTIYSLSVKKELTKLIQENHIDIVHIHNTFPLVSFSAYYAAKDCGCALVQTIHNFRLLCPNGLFYRDNHICEDCLKNLFGSVIHTCYRNSKLQSALIALTLWFHRKSGTFHLPDAYITLTDFNKQKLSLLIPANKIYIKPNSTATEISFSEKKSRNSFIFVSRLDQTKGIHLLLEVFLHLPNEKLIIIGTGPEEAYVKQFINDNHLTNVEYLGFTPQQEVLHLLYHAKALIFPTQWYEGFPVVLAESLSVGTPIICSNIGNPASIIEHGKTGLLFQYNSVSDCISKIIAFSSPSFDFATMEKNCQETFRKQYSPEQNYQLLISIYNKITKSI